MGRRFVLSLSNCFAARREKISVNLRDLCPKKEADERKN
jgi:hypothetical protein